MAIGKPENGVPSLDFYEYFCSKRLFYPKRHLKGNYYMLFEGKHSSSFFKTYNFKIKIRPPILNLKKRMFIYRIWRKSLELFLRHSATRNDFLTLKVLSWCKFTVIVVNRFLSLSFWNKHIWKIRIAKLQQL